LTTRLTMNNNLRSITDVLQAVFLLVRRKDTDAYGVLLITGAEDLQDMRGLLPTVAPGVYKLRWHSEEVKSAIALLRGLGRSVFIYDYDALRQWSAQVTDIPTYEQTVRADLQAILEHLPAHQNYVELYGGMTSPLFLKDPSPIEVVNDYARYIISFFHLLRDPLSFSWLFLLSRIMSPATNFDRSAIRATFQDLIEEDAILSAYAWYCYVHGTCREATAHKEYKDTTPGKVLRTLQSADAFLPELHSRIMRLQLEHNSIEKVVEINDSPETLFWVHIPHAGPGALDYEQTRQLITYLQEVKGSVVLYNDLLDENLNVTSLMTDLAKTFPRWNSLPAGNSVVYIKKQPVKAANKGEEDG
jgi:hypothetical protein